MKLIATIILADLAITPIICASTSTGTDPVKRSSISLGVSHFVSRLFTGKTTTPIGTSSEDPFPDIQQVIDTEITDLVIVTSDDSDKKKRDCYTLDRSEEGTEEDEDGGSESSLTDDDGPGEEPGATGAPLGVSTQLVRNNTDLDELLPNYDDDDDDVDDLHVLAASTLDGDTGGSTQLGNSVEQFDPEHLIIWEDEST